MTDSFHRGYKTYSGIVRLLGASVEHAVGDCHHGAPVNNLGAAFCPKSVDLGRFTRWDGVLTQSVVVTPPMGLHVRALCSGVVGALSPTLWLSYWAPFALGLWALTSLAA
jgi:hypothetical protein